MLVPGARSVDLGNGAVLAVSVAGSGTTTALFVHGYSMSRRTWDKVVPRFTRAGFCCVCYDLRGFGDSAWPEHGYDGQQHAADLRLLLDALELDRVVLCGHSLGGAVAQDFALAHPGRLLAVVASNAAARCLPLPALDAATRARLDALSDPERLAAAIRSSVVGYFHPGNATPEEVEQFRAVALAASPKALRDQLRDIYTARAIPLAAYAALAVPALVVSGADDRVTPPAHAEALVRAWPGSTAVTIAEAGHTPMWEQPDAWSREVLAFLSRCGLPAR